MRHSYISDLLNSLADGANDQVIIPDEIAQTVFRRGQATLRKWKRAGDDSPLTLVQIGNSSYVTLPCILAEMDRFDTWCGTMEKRLLAHLQGLDSFDPADGGIPYRDAMGWIDLRVESPPERLDFAQVLAEVMRRSWEQHGFLLSAVVTRQDSNLPGDQFFPDATSITGVDIKDDEKAGFARDQMQKAWLYARGTPVEPKGTNEDKIPKTEKKPKKKKKKKSKDKNPKPQGK